MFELKLTYQRRPVKTYQFEKDAVEIGRDPACDVPIDNIGISRRHTRVEKHGEFYVVRDLGSENGTYIRGRRIRNYNLNDEDEICVSNHALVFHRLDQPSCFEAEPAKAQAGGGSFEVTMPLDAREMDRMQMERASTVTGYLKFRNLSGREDTYTLLRSTTFFGTHQKSEFVVKGWFLGGKHAMIVRDEFGFRLISLAPKKPIQVNGKAIDDHRLKDGDKFAVGNREFSFHFGVPTK